VAIALAVLLLLVRGSRTARFAIVWLLAALAPVCFFPWSGVSRYAYLAGVPFALLLADGLSGVSRRLERRIGVRVARAVALTAFVVLFTRFALLARHNVAGGVAWMEGHREYIAGFQQRHPTLAPRGLIFVGRPDDPRVQSAYVPSMIQWAYRDATLRIQVR
jgi:hypothetical protein